MRKGHPIGHKVRQQRAGRADHIVSPCRNEKNLKSGTAGTAQLHSASLEFGGAGSVLNIHKKTDRRKLPSSSIMRPYSSQSVDINGT